MAIVFNYLTTNDDEDDDGTGLIDDGWVVGLSICLLYLLIT